MRATGPGSRRWARTGCGTLATEVLKAGAPLEEVASLLRHRRHATTVLYAKVDWQRLRELARPWPRSAA